MKYTLAQMVGIVLDERPETRNDDKLLWLWVCSTFFPGSFLRVDGINYLRVKDILDLPSQDSIKRTRAEYQNEEKMFLPTDPKVLEGRSRNSKNWKEHINKSYDV